MSVLVIISIPIGVDRAANGLMPYPDWLDRLVFVIRAAVLSVLIFLGLVVAFLNGCISVRPSLHGVNTSDCGVSSVY
jgi:ABC-type microcin C transport system permease subunit YejB